jgi:hypothetical protein
LAPLADIGFTLPPIREFVEFARVLLWRAKVKASFGDENLDLNSIEELVSTTPSNIDTYPDAYKEFILVQGVLRKAKDWRKATSDFMTEIDALFNQSNTKDSKKKLNNLKNLAKTLQHAYVKEDLKLITNLNHSYDQLKNSDEILRAAEFIIAMVNGELIELEEFLDTSSIIERRFQDDKKYSILMHQFQKIQREVIPSLEN